MNELLEKLALCVEKGKIDKSTQYPPELAGEDGADELTVQALDQGISPDDILNKACIVGMHAIGEKFKRNEVFVPQLLIAAKAMQSVMNHLKPYFASGEINTKGTFVIGTVSGDLHDIGKNLVSMVVEGAGWNVIDLGIDVSVEKYLESIENNQGCVVGLSALLTTTMANMEDTVSKIKAKYLGTKVIIGGAPVTGDFAREIGADMYSADPQGAVEFLNSITD